MSCNEKKIYTRIRKKKNAQEKKGRRATNERKRRCGERKGSRIKGMRRLLSEGEGIRSKPGGPGPARIQVEEAGVKRRRSRVMQ